LLLRCRDEKGSAVGALLIGWILTNSDFIECEWSTTWVSPNSVRDSAERCRTRSEKPQDPAEWHSKHYKNTWRAPAFNILGKISTSQSARNCWVSNCANIFRFTWSLSSCYVQKEKERQKAKIEEVNGKSANDTFTILSSTKEGDKCSADIRSRQAAISARIGIQPQPITPETHSRYSNLHWIGGFYCWLVDLLLIYFLASKSRWDWVRRSAVVNSSK